MLRTNLDTPRWFTLPLLGICALLSTAGCTAFNDCLELSLAKNGFTALAPAKLSMFFSVTTCAGEPVPGLTAESFSIAEDGKRVSNFESQKVIMAKGQKFRLHTLVLLDLSGSLLRSGDFTRLKEAAAAFVDSVLSGQPEGHTLAIYGFDGRANPFPVSEFSSDPAHLKAALESLSTPQCSTNADCADFPDRRTCGGWLCVDDSTNLNGAVIAGLKRLDSEVVRDTSIPFQHGALVLFTDGTDQAARYQDHEAEHQVSLSNHEVFTVGLGGEVDRTTLQSLGKSGFELASQTDELNQAFAKVGQRVLALANRFYLVEYCSPKRGGTHELTVSVTVPDGEAQRTGSLTHPFDASNFTSGCEISL